MWDGEVSCKLVGKARAHVRWAPKLWVDRKRNSWVRFRSRLRIRLRGHGVTFANWQVLWGIGPFRTPKQEWESLPIEDNSKII